MKMLRRLFGWMAVGVLASTANAAPLRYAGSDAELSLARVSDRTVEVRLASLDPTGKPIAAPASTALVDFPREVKWRGRELSAPEEVAIGNLRIQIKPSPLTLGIRRADGRIVQQFVWSEDDGTMRFRADGPVFGLGEGGPQFDRRGARYPMADGWGAYNRPVFGSRIWAPFMIGTDGWALFLQHPQGPQGEFDLRGREGFFRPSEQERHVPVELFVIAWDKPADVLAEYIRLTGPPPMPPKWALGYMQSHRTLAGPEEVMQVARTFRDKKLPCDALIYLGTGYCPAGWNRGHGSLEFNPKTFDRPAEILQQLHDLNFKVVLHVNSPPRALFGASLAGPSDSPVYIRNYWARHRALLPLGVDGWWPDDGDELPAEGRLARHRCYYEGPLTDRPNARPWSLHRTGYSGVQRYGGWIWSGDIDSQWSTLAGQVSVGLNHSLSLSPFWGTDTGGFFPTKELTGELYARWFQFSTFCPSFRSHGRTWHLRLPWGWNTGEFGPIEAKAELDPAELRNAEVEPICRKYLELRYGLLTYNYTLCREAHDTGLPLMRTLWLHYPDDAQAVSRGDEYLWGRDLLVAPVVAKGVAERTLYLPDGEWYDFWTHERHQGRREITRKVDLATLPLFVRAGAVLPLDPIRQYTGQPATEPIAFRIYTGRDGEYRWYQDDGQSLDYLRGKYSWTRLNWNDGQRKLAIEPERGSGGVPPAAAELRLELVPGGEAKTIRWSGKPVVVAFDEAAGK
jgi:alpha-glucosidase/alpha-D-xyloside xylohydrolase